MPAPKYLDAPIVLYLAPLVLYPAVLVPCHATLQTVSDLLFPFEAVLFDSPSKSGFYSYTLHHRRRRRRHLVSIAIALQSTEAFCSQIGSSVGWQRVSGTVLSVLLHPAALFHTDVVR